MVQRCSIYAVPRLLSMCTRPACCYAFCKLNQAYMQKAPSPAPPATRAPLPGVPQAGARSSPAQASSGLQSELPMQLRDHQAAVLPLLLAQLWHWAEAAPGDQHTWVRPILPSRQHCTVPCRHLLVAQVPRLTTIAAACIADVQTDAPAAMLAPGIRSLQVR